MAEKDGLTELAKLFKKNENQTVPSMTTGKVIALPPNPMIQITDIITLDKTQLVFASSVVNGLLAGDEVIVNPVTDGQLYYVLEKAVRFV